MSTDAPEAAPAAIPPPSSSDERRAQRLPAGWRAVARKELADHLLSPRFSVLLALLGLAAAATVYAAAGVIRDVASQTSETPALFLRLFSVAPERVPAFFSLVGFLAPLLGIAFGFDAVNGERAQGTLPRLLSQPIHRDDVINGKFVAGLLMIGMMLAALTVVVGGVGIVRLGIVPSAPEVARLLLWLVVLIFYVGVWLGLSMLFSVALRRAATSALASIAVWLVLALFFGLLVGVVADAIAPAPEGAAIEQVVRNARVQEWVSRISPTALYTEATFALLTPDAPNSGLVVFPQLRAIPSTLPVEQSLLVVWPQIVGLVALTVVCFAAAYVNFMRQEVRA